MPCSIRPSRDGGGGVINTISVDAIQEFKSTANASSAEYGRAGAGVVTVTTRSGTNNFHGGLFEYFQNDKLNANAFFANKNGTGKTGVHYNQFGGNLGGPIKHDKLFFFFNYEGAQVRRLQYVTGNVPTAALLNQLSPALRQTLSMMMPAPNLPSLNPLIGIHARNDRSSNSENTYLTKVDWLLSSRQRLAVRHSYNHQTTRTPNLQPTMPTIFPLRLHNVSVEHTFNVGPAALNELWPDVYSGNGGVGNVSIWNVRQASPCTETNPADGPPAPKLCTVLPFIK